MAFSIDSTLSNYDSKIRTDVESTARIILSEVDYILDSFNDVRDLRHQFFLLEAAVSKTAAIFQLAMRACDYFERKDLLKSFIEKTKKGSGSNLGTIRVLRDDHFHHGQSVLRMERLYPFARIKGRGYVGIYVPSGSSLEITGIQNFTSPTYEYAITSEGIFEIHDVGTDGESWVLMNTIANITSIEVDQLLNLIKGAVTELKTIWKTLRDVRISGDGTNEYSYLNEGGEMELLGKGAEGITSVKFGGSIRLIGKLQITPPDGVKVDDGKLSFFIQ